MAGDKNNNNNQNNNGNRNLSERELKRIETRRKELDKKNKRIQFQINQKMQEKRTQKEEDNIKQNVPDMANADNSVSWEEYRGVRNLFGDLAIPEEDPLTKEEQGYIFEQLKEKNEAAAKQSRLNFSQPVGNAFPNTGFQNTNPAGSAQNSISELNKQVLSGGVKIPGMGYVSTSKPKEEKKQPEKEPAQKNPTYVTMGIPGMRNGSVKASTPIVQNVPQLTQEERNARTLKNAEEQLAQLEKTLNIGTPDEKAFKRSSVQQLRKTIENLKNAQKFESMVNAPQEKNVTKQNPTENQNELKNEEQDLTVNDDILVEDAPIDELNEKVSDAIDMQDIDFAVTEEAPEYVIENNNDGQIQDADETFEIEENPNQVETFEIEENPDLLDNEIEDVVKEPVQNDVNTANKGNIYDKNREPQKISDETLRKILGEENWEKIQKHREEENNKEVEENSKNAEIAKNIPDNPYEVGIMSKIVEEDEEEYEEEKEVGEDFAIETNEDLAENNEPQIAESQEAKSNNKAPHPEDIDVPVFYAQLKERTGDKELTKEVKSQISEIFKEAGVEKQSDLDDIVDEIYEIVEIIEDVYEPTGFPEGAHISMRDLVRFVFTESFESIDKNKNLNVENRFETSQKISDVILKNYSPVTFADGKLDRFADNYVLSRPKILKDCLQIMKFPEDEIESIMQGGTQDNQNQVDNNDNVNVDDDIVVEDAAPSQGEVAADAIPLEDIVVGGENNPNTIANENTKSDQLQIPDFYEQLERRMKNPTVTKQVKAQLTDIIKEAGIKDPAKISEIVDFSYGYVTDSIGNIYISDVIAKTKMSFDAPRFFSEAHDSINDADLSPEDQIITAQKIADVMLKNYSPVAFANGALDRYAENYVVNSKSLLKDHLESQNLSAQEIEKLMQDVRATLERDPETNLQANGNEKDHRAPDPEPEKAPIAPNQNPNLNPQPAPEQIIPEAADKNSKEPVQEEKKAEVKVDKNEKKPQEKNPIANVDDGDELISGLEEDAFERKLAEQQKANSAKEIKSTNSEANAAVYTEKLNAYNSMYKVNLSANSFAFYTNEAWTLMKSGDAKEIERGQKILGTLFKQTLNPAFEAERNTSYNEHRLPNYTEIIKSANELLRASMFAFTDLYHDPKSASLFESTAFGGMKEEEMSKLTQGESLWKMDQKSDAAWEIQSKEAKDITEKWLKEDKPFEKMINEMNDLAAGFKKNGNYDRREARLKLAAAEWLLVNDSRMMIEDPEDPLNPIPNWGNRYWKTITQTREALGIDKHTSMRDLIQQEYAASAKAVNSAAYNKTQIKENVLSSEARSKCDSMELQKEQFATQSAHVTLTVPQNEKKTDEILMTSDRVQISIKTLDQREIMKNEPKSYNFVIERTAELTLSAPNQGSKK